MAETAQDKPLSKPTAPMFNAQLMARGLTGANGPPVLSLVETTAGIYVIGPAMELTAKEVELTSKPAMV